MSNVLHTGSKPCNLQLFIVTTRYSTLVKQVDIEFLVNESAFPGRVVPARLPAQLSTVFTTLNMWFLSDCSTTVQLGSLLIFLSRNHNLILMRKPVSQHSEPNNLVSGKQHSALSLKVNPFSIMQPSWHATQTYRRAYFFQQSSLQSLLTTFHTLAPLSDPSSRTKTHNAF
jgi:hypothetical protein